MSTSTEIPFDRSFDARPGDAVVVAPGIRRIVAPNPGPFTFTGTNTYIVGEGAVALVDPGPEDAAHRRAIEAALEGERVEAVVVTHTHRDHSPLAMPMAAAFRAPTYGFGPHMPARPLRPGEDERLDAGGDADFTPDIAIADGGAIEGDGWRLEAVHTPGHTANHLCFAVAGADVLLSGDHVMAWSTTVVAPPDGRMADYMASLDRLAARDESVFLPGHGGPVHEPTRFTRLLSAHRRQREAAILRRVNAGDRTVPAIVAAIYKGLDPRLAGAAGMSVLAHLEDLVERGLVASRGAPGIAAEFVGG